MKKLASTILAGLVAAGMLAACSSPSSSVSSVSPSSSLPATSVAASSETAPPEVKGAEFTIAGLKGPTTMGMVKLMEQAGHTGSANLYNVTMYGTPDEILPGIISGSIDVAAVPANLASILYNRTQGAVTVAAINTLGVLYVVEAGEKIQSIEDLRGKTIYSTGQGTTPEYALNYILTQNGIDPAKDVTIEFKSEATEVAAMLATSSDAVAVLPQPYVTAVQMQNDKVRIALDLTKEWDKVSEQSSMVTGVLVARKEFVESNPEAFALFLEDYAASIEWVNANTSQAAELIAQFGIVEKAAIAEKALPYSNIVFIAGSIMQQKLSGYLQVLFEQNPQSVGGALPGEDFYFVPEQ